MPINPQTDESWKTEVVINWLNEKGYRIEESTEEIVIEFLCGEIGIISDGYVSRRYRMDRGMAKSMLRDLSKHFDHFI
jgi:hypothetical protein